MWLFSPSRWLGEGLMITAAVLIAGFCGSIFAQSRTHNLGDYKLRLDAIETINTNDVEPTGEWPQDQFRYSTVVFHNNAFVVGSWVDSAGTTHSKEAFFDPVTFNEEAPYGLREVRRAEPPEVFVTANGVVQRSSRIYNGEVDPNLVADQMIELRYKAFPGFDVRKRSYSYANHNHNDYVIVEYTYTCTFDWDRDPNPDTDDTQTMQDVYFIVGYNFQTAEGTYITYARWFEEGKDDWATFESVPSTLNTGGRNLNMSYGWDGDHPDIVEFEGGGQEFDDTGDPRFAVGEEGASPLPSGEFISTAYSGFAALHVDTAPGNGSDDVTQPVSVTGNVSIYDMWNAEFPGFATLWDWAASGTRATVDEQAGWPDNAGDTEGEYNFQAFGPYSFQKGDSIKIAYAVGANGISRDIAVEKGLEWRSWYRGEAGADFDNDAKNDLLATGLDSLTQTLDRAMWAYRRGLDIPDPLRSPNLEVVSGPNRIDLIWEDLSGEGDPDTGVPDLAGYRIYRKLGDFLVDGYEELNPNGTHIQWELLAEVPPGQTTYTDEDVIRGESYHYAVTAVDNGSQNTDGINPGQALESSVYANRSELPASAFEPGADNTAGVRVVPNPFVLKAGDYNFTGDGNKLLFVNLPPYCTLRIFTATGDLIKTIEHASGSADESWDQVTESNQYLASGVYILQVDSARDLNGNALPGTMEKFVVIR